MSFVSISSGITFAYIQQNAKVNPPNPSLTPLPSSTPFANLTTPMVVKTKNIHPASPSPTPSAIKEEYSIVILGDSMVDTMGENLDYLDEELNKKYPQIDFQLYNYGMGAQTMFQAYDRFDDDFIYKTRDYPPLHELKPDILIVASFAYNPLYPFDRDKHWTKYAELVAKAKEITSEVYILVEVAPIGKNFGKGAGETAGWDDEQRLRHSSYIVDLLDNAIGIGETMNVPVIDVYSHTKENGNYGDGTYTNSNDGIHPSIKGHELTAQTISEIILK